MRVLISFQVNPAEAHLQNKTKVKQREEWNQGAEGNQRGSESGNRIVSDYHTITFFILLYSIVKSDTGIVATNFPKANYSFGTDASPNRCFHQPSRERLEWAILPLKPHLKQQIPLLLWLSLKLPLFNLDCLWRPLEQTPAAVAGSWLESGTFTRWWLMETNVRRGGRGSGGQDQIIGFHLRLGPSLSRLCQKTHKLRETVLIKMGNRF